LETTDTDTATDSPSPHVVRHVSPLLGTGLSKLLDRGGPGGLGGGASNPWKIHARPAPRPGRWLATLVVGVLVVMLAHGIVTNSAYGWGIVGHYFLSALILSGVKLTIVLTAVSMAVGIAIGILMAVMRMSANPLMANASRLYIWFFRGTPLLVQLIFWYDISDLYPKLAFGIPFGPTFVSIDVNHVLTGLVAAFIGLSLNEGAYMAEIVRGGILSVDAGQVEAARAVGMHQSLVLRRIVLPQAMRVIIPPTGNQVITMLKSTSLVSVLGIAELLYSSELIYQQNFEVIPLLVTASLWYLLMTTVLSVGQYYLERHFGRGQMSAMIMNKGQR
jgi:polar amino acid transport system permease protein